MDGCLRDELLNETVFRSLAHAPCSKPYASGEGHLAELR